MPSLERWGWPQPPRTATLPYLAEDFSRLTAMRRVTFDRAGRAHLLH